MPLIFTQNVPKYLNNYLYQSLRLINYKELSVGGGGWGAYFFVCFISNRIAYVHISLYRVAQK